MMVFAVISKLRSGECRGYLGRCIFNDLDFFLLGALKTASSLVA